MYHELDLRLTNEGVACEDYSLIMIAGLDSSEILPVVRERLNRHEKACSYHGSRAFLESALNTYVTPEIEAAAREVVERYTLLGAEGPNEEPVR